ncbi:ubiquitin carboxyl-terminal hydrolase MINDY-3 [Aplysia californica]|uniref:Ubiquitin carboxyl-terminal hydrolase MINDY n=1 Tax=Aplysia californica TaxID=6500 RepID=A0ABM0ZZY0_APLCA|nr:ubiquitin carboxyl-terminal hydrolase MINDY-3 [Aplysia californica]
MASFNFQIFEKTSLEDIKLLLWGASLKEEVFSRWSQGFIFSESSPTSLIQFEGGPCAVIAPVQAFLVKCALFGHGMPNMDALTSVSSEGASNLLLEALVEILSQMNSSAYVVVSFDEKSVNVKETSSNQQAEDEMGGPSKSLQSEESAQIKTDASLAKSDLSFHANLRYCCCNDLTDLRTLLKQMLPQLHSCYGVLLYLYSILCTKGIEQIKNEVEDPSEPLIDGIYGHGSQSLINLLLTSHATSNVWDNDKEISGLKLRGLLQQPTIGFLTLLEHMRYCEVGWYYKNPKFPVWLLGSETHLTVLFSTTESLVVKETPGRNANLIFAQFDPEGNGFISSSLLDDVMRALDLVSEKEYVDIMRIKLDAEELGIITRNSFMEEFFPEEPTEQVQSFSVYHHNALPQSCTEGKVMFVEGRAKLADEIDTQFICDTSPMALCLQTKWPSIEVTWSIGAPPSLN